MYLRDILNGKSGQLSSDGIEKFIRAQKIDPFASNIHQGPGFKIPTIQEI